MIWEVDEKNDEVVCFEEFCLTYSRNATAGNNASRDSSKGGRVESYEPSSLFLVMDFLMFDQVPSPSSSVSISC